MKKNKKLNNPKTQSYQEMKNYILSVKFPWYWHEDSTDCSFDETTYKNISYYSHCFLSRPEDRIEKIPKIGSDFVEVVSRELIEILKANKISINSFLRINANCVHPLQRVVNSVPHRDHNFDHKNMIVYLTGAGGKTIINGESYDPSEDDVIVFDGVEHYQQTPKKERRVVLVATFI